MYVFSAYDRNIGMALSIENKMKILLLIIFISFYVNWLVDNDSPP